ncbi:hypothetical protein MNV49_004514 [Pseudohyphozyma bogoriensis]|nr:hypothetical protein MNV49_004514 [Pseudohyphozyma bogoriensis]
MIAIGALAPPPPTPPPSSSFSDFRTLTFLALDSFTFDLFDFPAFMSALHSLTTLFIELYHPVPAAFLPSIAALPSGSLKHVGTKVYGSDSVYGSLCQVLEEAALARVDKWTLFDRVEEARGGDAYEEFVRRCRDKKLELQWKMWDNEVSAWGQGT